MKCYCHCHDQYLFESIYDKYMVSPYAYGPCCPQCAQTGKLDGHSLWRIVETMEVIHDKYMDATKYVLTFRAQNQFEQQRMVIGVSNQMLIKADELSVKHLIARHVREEFDKKGWNDYHLMLLSAPESDVQKLSMTSIKVSTHNAPMYGAYGGSYGESVSGSTVTAALRAHVPGIDAWVVCPVKPCTREERIVNLVQHVNDHHHWTRNEIADWLETLDVDLTFHDEPVTQPDFPAAKPNEVLIIVAPSYAAAKIEARRRRRNEQQWLPLNDARDAYRLRGRHKPQYYILPGYEPRPEIMHELLACGAERVGEGEAALLLAMQGAIDYTVKPSGPGVYIEETKPPAPMSDYIKEIYAAQIAYQEKMLHKELFFPPAKAPLKDMVVKFQTQPSPSYHAQILNNGTGKIHPCDGPNCVPCSIGAEKIDTHHHIDGAKPIGQWLDEAFDKPDPLQAALEAKKSPLWAKFNQPKKNPFQK